METINNTIYFESDEEFEDFCIAPYATIVQNNTASAYISASHSDMYRQCLADGKFFVIMDEDSKVYNRQCATKRVPVQPTGQKGLVQLKVENLKPWYDMPVPIKFRDTLAQLLSSNPEITYSEVAEALGVKEETAFMFLRNWKKENRVSS